MNNQYIIHNDQDKEYYFEEGCYILELANTETDPHLSIARARVLPNTSTKLHKLAGTIERYIILSGKGVVTVGDSKTEVQAMDVVVIPENTPQAISNTGIDDLVFIVVCTPRFIPENYSDC